MPDFLTNLQKYVIIFLSNVSNTMQRRFVAMRIAKVSCPQDGTLEYWAQFDPSEFNGSLPEALVAFSDQMVHKVGRRIDLTEVRIKHDKRYRANGFIYRYHA